MNVWDWVWDKDEELRQAGHNRLADLMDQIPDDTFANNHESVDLCVDEAIQLAKDLKEPWVEIFIRHWRLQSKIMYRQQPKEMIREAVELLEFSHRPENINCPQSVCVIQDLTTCYGATDGPGYYRERIEVCEETLKRISPRWTCYECIASEHVSALYDNGEYQEALDKIDEIEKQVEQVGDEPLSCELELIRTLLLIRLKRYDSAKRVLKKINLTDESVQFRLEARLYHALVSACEGNYVEALDKIPDYEELKQNSELHLHWIEVTSLCATENIEKISKSHLNTCMHMLLNAEERGAYRFTLQMGEMVALMFKAAGDSDTAHEALKVMRRVQTKLRADLGASVLIEAVSVKISAP